MWKDSGPVGSSSSRSVRPKNGGASGSAVERLQPLGADPAQALAGEFVHAVVGDAFGGLSHRDQAAPGEFEMVFFSGQYCIVGHD